MIVEKKLGIKPDYQYNAIRSFIFPQANWHKNKITAVRELVDINKSTRILDLGTGSGNLELAIAGDCCEILGVDYNDEAIDFLKSKLSENNISNVKLVVKDINAIDDLNEGKFDLIVMIDVIEHLRIADAEKLVNKFKDLLNPDGEVFIITPNYKSLWIYIEKVLDKVSVVPKFDGEQHLSKFHSKNLTSMFEKAGFSKKNITTFNYISFLMPLSILSRWFCKMELKLKLLSGNLIIGRFKLDK